MLEKDVSESTEWVSLGGNNPGNIGGNCHLLTHQWTGESGSAEKDAILIDLGAMFGSKAAGYDQFLPAVDAFLERPGDPVHKKNKLEIAARGLFLTHGHMDHIGAIGHFVKRGFKFPPIYCSRLTANLLRAHLAGFISRERQWPTIVEMEPGQVVSCGKFEVEAVPVSHSVPQSFAFHVRTPKARMVFSGDCKVDQSIPVGPPTDLPRLAEIGALGVDALMLDSTRVHSPGFTTEEKKVRDTISAIMARHPDKRIVIAVMGSSLQRVASIVDASTANGRKVIHEGPSIKTNLYALGRAGIDLSAMYPGARIHIGKSQEAQGLSPGQATMLVTGTQGEFLAALPMAARGQHRRLHLSPKNDVIIVSASVIPGNETEVGRMLSALRKQGFTIITAADEEVYSSGHAATGDVKTIRGAVKPKVLIPVHGSDDHVATHEVIMAGEGQKTLVIHNGDIVCFGGEKGAEVIGKRPHVWLGVVEHRQKTPPRLAADATDIQVFYTYEMMYEQPKPPVKKPVSPAPVPKI